MTDVTNKKLWKEIKEKWHKGSKGGKAGQWNARKAQLAVKEYKKRGGKYKTKYPKKNNSLKIWTDANWGYIDDKKGNRYLPIEVRKRLTIEEKKRENRLKKNGTSQYVPWSDTVRIKYRKYGTKPDSKKK